MSEIISVWWMWAVPLAFVAVLFYAFSRKRTAQFREQARIPLEDEPPRKG